MAIQNRRLGPSSREMGAPPPQAACFADVVRLSRYQLVRNGVRFGSEPFPTLIPPVDHARYYRHTLAGPMIASPLVMDSRRPFAIQPERAGTPALGH